MLVVGQSRSGNLAKVAHAQCEKPIDVASELASIIAAKGALVEDRLQFGIDFGQGRILGLYPDKPKRHEVTRMEGRAKVMPIGSGHKPLLRLWRSSHQFEGQAVGQLGKRRHRQGPQLLAHRQSKQQ